LFEFFLLFFPSGELLDCCLLFFESLLFLFFDFILGGLNFFISAVFLTHRFNISIDHFAHHRLTKEIVNATNLLTPARIEKSRSLCIVIEPIEAVPCQGYLGLFPLFNFFFGGNNFIF
jgi:hypothetical protein